MSFLVVLFPPPFFSCSHRFGLFLPFHHFCISGRAWHILSSPSNGSCFFPPLLPPFFSGFDSSFLLDRLLTRTTSHLRSTLSPCVPKGQDANTDFLFCSLMQIGTRQSDKCKRGERTREQEMCEKNSKRKKETKGTILVSE